MADIIPGEATHIPEDVPNLISIAIDTEPKNDVELFLEGILDVADENAIWVFGVGGPA